MRSIAPSVCHKILSICSCTRKFRATYRHLRTICEHLVENSPTDSFSSFFNWWSSKHGVAIFLTVESSYSQVQYISTHFFAWPSMSWDQEDMISASGFPGVFVGSFSLAPAEILDSNISLYFVTVSLLIIHSLRVQPKYTWSRNDVRSSKSTFFIKNFQVFQPVLHRRHTQMRIVLFLD